MAVIKRSKTHSIKELLSAITALNTLLAKQKEHDAVKDLQQAAALLDENPEDLSAIAKAKQIIVSAFEDEHELMAYTMQREDSKPWGEAEELSQASWKVISLAKRLKS